MTKIFVDSSTRKACFVFEGEGWGKPRPIFVPYPGPVTNNVGEYTAVILALEEARRLQLEQVELLTDSLLVVNQVNGRWAVCQEHLKPLKRRVLLLAQVQHATIAWVPREENLAGKYLG